MTYSKPYPSVRWGKNWVDDGRRPRLVKRTLDDHDVIGLIDREAVVRASPQVVDAVSHLVARDHYGRHGRIARLIRDREFDRAF